MHWIAFGIGVLVCALIYIAFMWWVVAKTPKTLRWW